ncbi:MAG: filamentous hemagglutinin N-terminal domain-containing protein [Phormidesmis sp. RL_2_1]|nr:filamentous hemagglutinin N-terminal domain-containing protein [Phormidesmis sp. RL_2_1]
MRSPRFLCACLLSSFAALLGSPVYAQITPDQTLGIEESVVTPNVEVRGGLADLIEGGAARGPNLFHSFSDFNVLDSQRVYFANPDGIESILSQVTGNDLSNIFGTLGVDGAAELFLINPNGIVFGSDVNLDVEGSFYATTAEAVALGEGVFSATTPEQSKLLMVRPDASFFSYLTTNSGNIVNRGQVVAGGDVTLAANNLDLQGQVAGGGDLSLLAADTVKIRDTAENPFVALLAMICLYKVTSK